MNLLIKTGRAFYATALIVYGIQQFYFGTFRNVFFSAYQYHLPFLNIASYVFGAYLICTAILLLIEKRGREAALLLGGVLLLLFVATQLTYQFFSQPNRLYHLGLWTNELKELALAGGAFVVAGSFCPSSRNAYLFQWLHRFTPYGNLFFLFTMICFGICHLIYGPFLENYVPAWWPDHLFWVYFTGVALVGAGVAIALGIKIRAIALLMAIMTFLWLWMVHVPSAVQQPVVNRGDQLASAFDALAFSGISLLIAFTMKEQKWIALLEKWERPERRLTSLRQGQLEVSTDPVDRGL